LLLQLLELLVLLLEEDAQLLRFGARRGGGVVRRLLLRLDGLRLELAVLLLEESGFSAQGGDLDLVRGLHLGAQRGLRRAPGLLDRPGRRRGADGRRGNPTRGRDASLWLVRHETRLRLA